MAQRIEAAGANALAIDAGCYESRYWTFPETYQAPGCLVDLSEMVKKIVNIPVIAVGKLGYPELAERVLAEGKADFVALGRALLADPEWSNKVREGKLKDICPCIGDNEGCLRRSMEQKYISCSVNPMTGMEREFALKPTKKKKSVLVVGGGPAGMEAARVSAIRGHEVTIWEKNDTLGGNLIPASVPEFKLDYKRLIDYLSTQVEELGITVQLEKEGTSELVEKMRPDVVFIATGAEPIIPEIPGVQEQKVCTAVDVLLGNKEVGNSVIIIGGGIVGCETALYLMKKGKDVTILEALDSVMHDVYPINRMHLLNLISSAKILTEITVTEINDKGVIIENEHDRNRALSTDTVIVAAGFRSRKELFESLKHTCSEIYTIGDCVKPRKIINAIWEGFRIARMI
jgi:2-enoate reductase